MTISDWSLSRKEVAISESMQHPIFGAEISESLAVALAIGVMAGLAEWALKEFRFRRNHAKVRSPPLFSPQCRQNSHPPAIDHHLDQLSETH